MYTYGCKSGSAPPFSALGSYAGCQKNAGSGRPIGSPHSAMRPTLTPPPTLWFINTYGLCLAYRQQKSSSLGWPNMHFNLTSPITKFQFMHWNIMADKTIKNTRKKTQFYPKREKQIELAQERKKSNK